MNLGPVQAAKKREASKLQEDIMVASADSEYKQGYIAG